MSAHLARAQLLLAQSRAADAERESMLALAAQPDDPQALALLALCRIEQDKREPALESAREAVGLAPDLAYFHYVHAVVLHRMDREEEAFRAAQEALRLDPADADHFSLLAAIELGRRRWPAALEAAEQALALHPEHVGASNLRAMALVRLGRKEEAMATVDFALHRAPENGFSHANQGWNCLHQNDPRKAQEHFREALRLEPDLEYARQGMLEALKARNPLYRGMLAYFLWSARLSAHYQWALVLGSLVASQLLIRLAVALPHLKWLWWLVLGLFFGFVYLTWTAHPMFNLLLRFDRFGRYVLSADQRTASNWFALFFFAALYSLGWFFFSDSDVAFFSMYFLAVLSVCVAATFQRTERARTTLGLAAAGLAVIAALAMLPLGKAGQVPNGLTTYFSYGFLAFQFLASRQTIK